MGRFGIRKDESCFADVLLLLFLVGMCVFWNSLFLAIRHAFHNVYFFLSGENEVFLTKVNELERRFYLETSVAGAKYSKLNYSIYTFS